ncbi:hypothetical protein [Belnapia moabensis]|uniref:hypothetical protein n=1 Tax=Belnapia moabensis TaxID=365533 RepID=UPI0012EEC6C1|nr:hypothetical protein [Belnapia moabensis]
MSGVTAEQVAALCDAAGMDEGDPLRASMVGLARSAEDLHAAADRIGREAAGRAASAAVAECRLQMARVAREVSWIRRLAVAGLVLLAAGGGWWAGQRLPQPTPLGRLTPAQAETLRWNDLGALLESCQRGVPQGDRDWCGFTRGWWLSPPPLPKGGKG